MLILDFKIFRDLQDLPIQYFVDTYPLSIKPMYNYISFKCAEIPIYCWVLLVIEIGHSSSNSTRYHGVGGLLHSTPLPTRPFKIYCFLLSSS